MTTINVDMKSYEPKNRKEKLFIAGIILCGVYFGLSIISSMLFVRSLNTEIGSYLNYKVSYASLVFMYLVMIIVFAIIILRDYIMTFSFFKQVKDDKNRIIRNSIPVVCSIFILLEATIINKNTMSLLERYANVFDNDVPNGMEKLFNSVICRSAFYQGTNTMIVFIIATIIIFSINLVITILNNKKEKRMDVPTNTESNIQ